MAKHLIPAKYPNDIFQGYVMRCPNADPWNNQLESTDCVEGPCYICRDIPEQIQVTFSGMTETFGQCCNVTQQPYVAHFKFAKLAFFPYNTTHTLTSNVAGYAIPPDPCKWVKKIDNAIRMDIYGDEGCTDFRFSQTLGLQVMFIANWYLTMLAYNYGSGTFMGSGYVADNIDGDDWPCPPQGATQPNKLQTPCWSYDELPGYSWYSFCYGGQATISY